MKTAPSTLLSLLIASLSFACTPIDEPDDEPEPPPGKPDDADKRSCQKDGSYGDGTCDLNCIAPDIDCFTIFESSEQVADYYDEILSDGMPQLTEADPRFQRLDALVAEGWEAYRAANSVGELPRPALVVVDDGDDPSANAFVARDGETIAWLVAIHASFTEAYTDDMIIGTIFHELEHAAGLHLLGEVALNMRRFYSVREGAEEPLGFAQPKDASLALHGNRWIDAAGIVGGHANEELAGVPLTASPLGEILGDVLGGTAGCELAEADYIELEFLFFEQPVFGVLLEPLSPARLQRVADVTTAVRAGAQECLADDARDLIDVIAERIGVDPEAVRGQLTSEQLDVIVDKPLALQIFGLGELTQVAMRSAETSLMEERGVRLSELRYYSDEEAADDSAARTLHAAGRPAGALGESFFVDLGETGEQACRERLDAGTVPYGNLSSTHHSTCWRIGHARQMTELLERD